MRIEMLAGAKVLIAPYNPPSIVMKNKLAEKVPRCLL